MFGTWTVLTLVRSAKNLSVLSLLILDNSVSYPKKLLVNRILLKVQKKIPPSLLSIILSGNTTQDMPTIQWVLKFTKVYKVDLGQFNFAMFTS